MTRKEYTISDNNHVQKSEPVLRHFLLSHSDSIRLTEIRHVEIGFFRIKRFGGEKDIKFIETLGKLKPFFIKKITNNQKYNDIEQHKNAKYNHYFYRLTPTLKTIINKEKLFFNYPHFGSLHGFEDPTFYKKEVMMGGVITHEPIIILYLTAGEKSALEKKGVFFD